MKKSLIISETFAYRQFKFVSFAPFFFAVIKIKPQRMQKKTVE